jgi:hypothetical protein
VRERGNSAFLYLVDVLLAFFLLLFEDLLVIWCVLLLPVLPLAVSTTPSCRGTPSFSAQDRDTAAGAVGRLYSSCHWSAPLACIGINARLVLLPSTLVLTTWFTVMLSPRYCSTRSSGCDTGHYHHGPLVCPPPPSRTVQPQPLHASCR